MITYTINRHQKKYWNKNYRSQLIRYNIINSSIINFSTIIYFFFIEQLRQSKFVSSSVEDKEVRISKMKTFATNDAVHGTISLPEVCKKFIDHHLFQRMRQIKQLGVCEHVYIGATHTRFSHSIGTCHLAYTLLEKLRFRERTRVRQNARRSGGARSSSSQSSSKTTNGPPSQSSQDMTDLKIWISIQKLF